MSEATILVTGRGEVHRVPDRVRLTLDVGATDANYAEAVSRAERAADAVCAALAPLGVPLKGASLHTEPVFEPQGRRRTGYRAARRLKAELSADPARLAAIAETLGRSGAEPSFSAEYFLSDERAARREAAALAVGEARERAEAIAAAAGVRLGRILRIESGARAFPAVRAMAMKACDLSDLAPEEIALDEDVTMLFDIG